MNLWMWAAFGVGLCLVPCADLCLRGSAERRLMGLELSSIIATVLLVLMTVGYHRQPFIDLPLSLAIMSLGAGLVFVRFLEKHL